MMKRPRALVSRPGAGLFLRLQVPQARSLARRCLCSKPKSAGSVVCQVRDTVLKAAQVPAITLPLRASNVISLKEPVNFLAALHDGVRSATSCITLAALYWGIGDLEKSLVKAIDDSCAKRADLKVRVLLDHSRAQRGTINSLTVLGPLCAKYPGRVQVLLFQMPQLREGVGSALGSPLNEVMAVCHVKAAVFDDDLLMTGANLSHDYFTNRQDRYVLFKGADRLAAFYHKLVGLLQEYCHNFDASGSSGVLHPPRKPLDTLRESCTALLGELPSEPCSSSDDSDTWAIPTLHLHPLGLNHDLAVTQALLDSCSLEDPLHLATAYLNPPPMWWHTITSWPGGATVIAPSPSCHGFAGAAGVKAFIPQFYATVQERLVKAMSTGKNASRLLEYNREDWTFHGKGIWASAAGGEVGVTVVGSSNFGYRSAFRDFESQVMVLTSNKELRGMWEEERAGWLEYCREVDAPSVTITRAAPILEGLLRQYL